MRKATALTAALLFVGACAGGGADRQVDANAAEPTRDGQPGKVSMPTLPDLHDRYPSAFDENGCVILEAGGRSCPAPADDERQPDNPFGGDEVRRLEGFEGRWYATDLSTGSGTVIVLEETVSTEPSGPWRALGLVQNQTANTVGRLTVSATLLGPDGDELGTATAVSPVASVRSGEPAPFEIESAVSGEKVASVAWKVESEALDHPVSRRLEVQRYGSSLAYGERERASDAIAFQDPESPPFPYVNYGDVRNFGSDTVDRPIVVGAWLDGEGRVRALRSTDLRSAPKTTIDELQPGAFGYFAFVTQDAALADALAGLELTLWGLGQ